MEILAPSTAGVDLIPNSGAHTFGFGTQMASLEAGKMRPSVRSINEEDIRRPTDENGCRRRRKKKVYFAARNRFIRVLLTNSGEMGINPLQVTWFCSYETRYLQSTNLKRNFSLLCVSLLERASVALLTF